MGGPASRGGHRLCRESPLRSDLQLRCRDRLRNQKQTRPSPVPHSRRWELGKRRRTEPILRTSLGWQLPFAVSANPGRLMRSHPAQSNHAARLCRSQFAMDLSRYCGRHSKMPHVIATYNRLHRARPNAASSMARASKREGTQEPPCAMNRLDSSTTSVLLGRSNIFGAISSARLDCC